MKMKLFPLDLLTNLIFLEKQQGRKIVFTNGCFDILHAGHIDLFWKAKSLGDILVVGLNSDESIQKNKGPHRPINNQEYRVFLLNSLEPIDYVVLFEEETPEHLIRNISPHILVKGGDYDMDSVVGSDWVVSHGGSVCLIPHKFLTSTSKIIESILKL